MSTVAEKPAPPKARPATEGRLPYKVRDLSLADLGRKLKEKVLDPVADFFRDNIAPTFSALFDIIRDHTPKRPAAARAFEFNYDLREVLTLTDRPIHLGLDLGTGGAAGAGFGASAAFGMSTGRAETSITLAGFF